MYLILLKSSFSNKIIGVLIVVLGSLVLPKSIETDFICAGSFSPEAFYFVTIPYFISFINSIFVISYMSYTKYRISKVPGQNLKFRSSQIQTISGRIQNTNNQRRHQGRRIAWQESSRSVPGTLSCYPPAISGFFEVLSKYLKFNIFNLFIMALNLPEFVFICFIRYWNLKCDEWKLFTEYAALSQMIFVFLYPYFVKVKLMKFS